MSLKHTNSEPNSKNHVKYEIILDENDKEICDSQSLYWINNKTSNKTQINFSSPIKSFTKNSTPLSISISSKPSLKKMNIITSTSKSKGDIKKQNHNEVERRRRNKINAKIEDIIAIIPTASDVGKDNPNMPSEGESSCPLFVPFVPANNLKVSKIEALDHAYRYIIWLQRENLTMKNKISCVAGPEQERLAEMDQYKMKNLHLQQELTGAKADNKDIINQLQNMGIPISLSTDSESETASIITTLHQQVDLDHQTLSHQTSKASDGDVNVRQSQFSAVSPQSQPAAGTTPRSHTTSISSSGPDPPLMSRTPVVMSSFSYGSENLPNKSPQPMQAIYEVQSPQPRQMLQFPVQDQSPGTTRKRLKSKPTASQLKQEQQQQQHQISKSRKFEMLADEVFSEDKLVVNECSKVKQVVVDFIRDENFEDILYKQGPLAVEDKNVLPQRYQPKIDIEVLPESFPRGSVNHGVDNNGKHFYNYY